MKATAKAPSNIAFIKYWGKKNEELRIPANSSISMNLSNAKTTTTVEFDSNFKTDSFMFFGEKADEKESQRVFRHLDRIRKLAKLDLRAKVTSKNNFPKGTGIASSASGFAALTVAAAKAADLDLPEKELSILARIGSGSACRSIPDGFVEWKTGKISDQSFAISLYPADYWDLRDVIAIIGKVDKKVSSSEGHAVAESSPFYSARIENLPKKVDKLKRALAKKDFTLFGEIIEAEAVNMHAVMMTSKPALFYWLPKSLEVMYLVQDLRSRGVECYFTIDAGPNIHIICEGKSVNKIKRRLIDSGSIKDILINKASVGTKII